MASNAFDLSTARWRRSSYSNASGGDCVEVAPCLPGVIPVRDSKRAEESPILLFKAPAWSSWPPSRADRHQEERLADPSRTPTGRRTPTRCRSTPPWRGTSGGKRPALKSPTSGRG
ncbi:DUF397 domain-containing protein [Streptomyces sp. NPDC001020]